jgi:hypothetical protein
MSELHYGTETAEPAGAPAREVGDYPGYDETTLGAEYDEHLGALAAGGQLPTRQDSRAATWGDDPEFDETALGAEYDGGLEALAAGDELPARQDSHAATWGESPEYYDEANLGFEYDGDLSALTVVPETGHAMSESGDNDPDTASAVAGDPAADDGHAATEAGPQTSVQERERSTADQAMPEEGADAASAGAEDPGQSPGEAADSSKAGRESEADRSLARANEQIAELEARLERLERDREAEPGTDLTSQELDTGQQVETEAAKGHPRHWRIPSDEGLAFGATTAGGVITTIAEYVPFVHADIAGMVAGGIAIAATAITWMRSRREGKDGHRSKN